jgi:hypothetical protein
MVEMGSIFDRLKDRNSTRDLRGKEEGGCWRTRRRTAKGEGRYSEGGIATSEVKES